MARLDPLQPFLPTLTIVANYAVQKNTQPQHALNLQTQGQNVPSAEVGIRLIICGLKCSLCFGLGHMEDRCLKESTKGLPTITNFLEVLVVDEKATLVELNRICGGDQHIFFGARIPKRRLHITTNLAEE